MTAVQEGVKLDRRAVDNHGYQSIGSLSRSVGSDGFGTRYRFRNGGGAIAGEVLPVDLVANAASLGVHAVRARTLDELRAALTEARAAPQTTVS